MSHTIAGIYENGVIRPLEDVDLAEGERVSVIVNGNVSAEGASRILEGIAKLPLEGTEDIFSGRDHDTVLYGKTRE